MSGPWDEVEDGHGCDTCPWGSPMIRVASRYAAVSLCWQCAKSFLGGGEDAVRWLEENLRPFGDPLGDRLEAAIEKELA